VFLYEKGLVREITSDWRRADVGGKLRAALGFIEKLTVSPGRVTPEDAAALRAEGVSGRAIVDLVYVCVGFNVINRIADALAFRVPPPRAFNGGAKYLRLFGYRLLSGSFIGGRVRRPAAGGGPTDDPYRPLVERLKADVLSGPGTLDREVREAAGSCAEAPGTLGRYIGEVTRGSYERVEADMAVLRREGHSDDQLFEATVSAALGAGLLRREVGLDAARGSSSAPTP
jgi:alkylhydroperoxidase family enzyme